jgi:hypothetical protein
MKTQISRTYEIVNKKSATARALRDAGFIIHYQTIVSTSKLNVYKQIKTIGELCKSGCLRKKSESIHFKSENSLYKGHIEAKFNVIKIKRNKFARLIGESYHNHIASLYQSQRAEVQVLSNNYDPAAVEHKDYNAYSKSYGFPATWKNAAAVVKGNEFELFNYRGNSKGTFAIPHWKQLDNYNFECLIDNDLYAIKRSTNIYKRFDAQGKLTGYAKKMKHPENGKPYWEHGRDLKEIAAEFEHKKQLAADKIERERIRKIKLEKEKKIERAKRLIMRIVNRADVTFSDARAVGYCAAGIKGFCDRNGIDFNENAKVKFAFLKRHPETLRLRDHIAQQLALTVIEKL